MSKAYTSNGDIKIEGPPTRISSANAKIKNDQYSTSLALIDKELRATSKRCSNNDFLPTSNNAPYREKPRSTMIKAKKELDNISRRSVSNDFIPTRSNETHSRRSRSSKRSTTFHTRRNRTIQVESFRLQKELLQVVSRWLIQV